MLTSDGSGPSELPAGGPRRLACRGPGLRAQGLFPLSRKSLADDLLDGCLASQKVRIDKLTDEAVWSLNFLHGESSRPRASASNFDDKVKYLQDCTQRRLTELVTEIVRETRAMDPREGLKVLLRGRSAYCRSVASGTATYKYSQVAVPSDLSDAVALTTLLPAQVSELLVSFEQRMLRDEESVALINATQGEPTIYTDPVLKGSKKHMQNSSSYV